MHFEFVVTNDKFYSENCYQKEFKKDYQKEKINELRMGDQVISATMKKDHMLLMMLS